MKKFHLEPDNCTFVVDKENRRVICYIEDTSRWFLAYVDENCRINGNTDSLWRNLNGVGARNSLCSKLHMPNRFCAIAKCDPNDPWDENIGKVVAFSKLKDKVVKSFFKRVVTFFDFIEAALDDFELQCTELQSSLNENHDMRNQYIQQLIDKAR